MFCLMAHMHSVLHVTSIDVYYFCCRNTIAGRKRQRLAERRSRRELNWHKSKTPPPTTTHSTHFQALSQCIECATMTLHLSLTITETTIYSHHPVCGEGGQRERNRISPELCHSSELSSTSRQTSMIGPSLGE